MRMSRLSACDDATLRLRFVIMLLNHFYNKVYLFNNTTSRLMTVTVVQNVPVLYKRMSFKLSQIFHCK